MQINSERMVLRSVEPGDADALFAYRSDKYVNRFQGWIPDTREEATEFILNRVSPDFNIPGTWHQMILVRKDTGGIIGDAGIHFIDTDQVELGITLAEQAQGHGFATEALTAVISHLFLVLKKHRITASIDPANEQSIRLVTRLGFRQEAHFRQSLMINGVWADDLVYGLLAEEWGNRNYKYLYKN